MFGLGSKALERTDGLSIGLKMTKGCARGALPTGIMLELFKLSMCEDPVLP